MSVYCKMWKTEATYTENELLGEQETSCVQQLNLTIEQYLHIWRSWFFQWGWWRSAGWWLNFFFPGKTISDQAEVEYSIMSANMSAGGLGWCKSMRTSYRLHLHLYPQSPKVWILQQKQTPQEAEWVFFPHFLIKTIMSFTHRGTIRRARFPSPAHIHLTIAGILVQEKLCWLHQNEGSS